MNICLLRGKKKGGGGRGFNEFDPMCKLFIRRSMFFFVQYGKQPYVSACNSVSHE